MNLVEKIKIVVDDVTTVGSAFAATSEGEAVFINARIVNAVKIKHGDILEAHVLPNYEDKRASVPWRAMRASVQGSIFNEFSDEDETPVHTNHDGDGCGRCWCIVQRPVRVWRDRQG